MSCVQCGSTLNPGAKFCPTCGTAVTAARATATAAPPPVVAAPPPPLSQYTPPPPYVAQPGYAYVQRAKTNGLAIASMVLGILWLYWIGSILAVIFGHVAKNQIDKSGGTQGGRGMAIAGIVLGWIGVGTLALVILLAVASSSN